MESAIKTIRLSGSLGDLFGRVHKLAVANVAEAVRALCATRPGFEKYLMESKDNGLVFAVYTGKENISEKELKNPTGESTIRIVPVIAGSKKSGLLQTIVGAVLVVAGVFVAGMELFTFGGITNGQIGAYIAGMGISMMVGGIVQMLTPVPKKNERTDDERKSYMFNGAVNVQAQGSSVPVLYGELIVGSVVVSAGISSEDNYIVPYTEKETGPGRYRDGGSMIGDVIERSKDATR